MAKTLSSVRRRGGRANRGGAAPGAGRRHAGVAPEPMEARRMFAAHIVGSSTVYSTIQAAVNAAAAGSTITVDAGTYDETVSIYEPLTIDGANVNVDARGTRGAESIVYATQTAFYVGASDVTINGFTIEGDDANIGAQEGAGVLMAPSIHGTHVLDNIIQNNVTGIYLSNNSNTDECVIQHNLIQNNFEAGNNWLLPVGENGSRGIYTDGTVSGGYLTNVLIDSNTLYNSNFNGGDEDEGMIALQALTAGKQFNITITNNYIGNESKALLATNVTNLVFMGNTCTNLDDGSSGPVRFEGDANNVDIQYNLIDGNTGPGIAVDSSGVAGDSSGFVVDDNDIYGNDGIGFITQAGVYDGPIVLVGDWWGSASGPGGDGPGTGQAVWANGTTGHSVTPAGLAGGGPITYSPWATSLISITSIPVPAADTGLTVSPAAAGQLTLSWTAPSSTATSQLIQRSTDGVNFTTVATVPALLNTYTDTGLTTGVTYTYRVITANNAGTAAASNTAAAAPPVYQLPEPANGITAASTTSNSITLQWNVPSYPYGIATYTVYRNGTAVGTSTTTSFTDTGLSPDTAYTYTVRTTDTTGAVSAPTAPTSLVTGHSQFLDPSFELTPAANVYDPATANWTFTGKSAIEYSGGAYGTVGGIPNGSQFAVIQGISGNPIGAISQTMTVKTTGAYTISLYVAQRSGYTTEPVTVSMDGTLLGTFTPTSTTFAQFTTNAFALYAGAHTFTFSGKLNSGDDDSFVDQVSLNLVSNASVPGTPVITSVGAASATSAVVTWAPGGFGATSYTVLRSTDGTTWTTAASNLSPTVTSYTDTGLSPLTTYSYEVYATNSGIGSSGTSNGLSATTLSAAAATTALSSLTPASATSGFKTVQNNASVQGNVLTLHGTTYASGLGTSAASVITFNLGGGYTQFTTDVGIDAEENSAGAVLASVDFQVLGDGKVLFDSGDLGINSPTVHIDVPVAGVQVLTLVATNGVAGIAYDHADWAGATLWTNPSAPPAPTGLTAVAVSASSVTLTWSPTTAAVTSYAVDRSTDDVNFTTVATGLAASATSWTDTSVPSSGVPYYYRIRAVNAVGPSTNSAVASVVPPIAAPVSTPLTTLNWTTATAGYGTTQKNASISGNTLDLHGVTYATGIGTHAASTIVYNLAGAYNVFSSDVGIDYEENGVGTGSVDFQVYGDGKLLYDSGILTSASPTDHFAVNVTGVQTLTLVATNGVPGSNSYDHADWAGATLLTNATAPAAPTGLTAVAVSASSVTLTWSPTTAMVTSYAVDRSTDGVNFTTVATGLAASATSWTDTSALSAGTTYFYRIRALNAAGSSGNSTIASVTTLAPAPVSTALTTLNWTSATAGYSTVQKNTSIAGNTLNLHGVTYATGIGTHAASTIVYNLAGAYNVFSSDVGIDYEENGVGTGSVDFQVYGDGKLLYDSGVLTSASPTDHFAVNVTGVQTLTLVATNGVAGSIDYDHADWAGATLLTNATAPAAPTNVAAVATGSGSVTVSWTPGSSNQTSFAIDRSTDGVNFTTIAPAVAGGAISYVDTSGLSASTTYYYRVRANGAAGTSANSAVATATTLSTIAVTTPLSSLTWTSATAGYGTVQKNTSISGNTLDLHGVTYATGIGTHAASTLVYNLAGAYSVFSADVGIDYEENGVGSGSVDFQVVGDGKVLFDTGVLTSASPTAHIAVSVAGVQTLTLVATNGVAGSIDYDHADWAGAALVSVPTAPAAPTNLTATAVTASAVSLSWTAPGTNVASYAIDRSTDDATWTTVTTTVAGTATAWTDPTALSASTTYYYRVRAVNTAGTSVNSAVASATTTAPQTATALTSLAWTSATSGWQTVQVNQSVKGNPLTVAGTTYATGLGANAASTVVYNLGGAYSAFTATVGIDQEEDGKGSGYVDFQVYGDGVLLFDSGVLTNDQSAKVAVSVAGVQTLTLVANNGIAGDIDYDHDDWAGAQLLN